MSALKDISSVEGSAALLGAIRKEQFFTEKFARAAERRFAETGKSDFQLNPKALKPVTAGVGVVDKSHKSAEDEEKKEENLKALKAILGQSTRTPQERSSLPVTAANDLGWHWKDPEAAIITRKPLTSNSCKRCDEVKYGEAFASCFFAGPFNKTQPIARSYQSFSPTKT